MERKSSILLMQFVPAKKGLAKLTRRYAAQQLAYLRPLSAYCHLPVTE